MATYFDRIAKEFDNPRRVGRARHIAARIAQAIAGYEDQPVMEYGCGTGLVSFCLADGFADITLMDSSAGMIGEARRKIEEAGAMHMHAAVLDMSAEAHRGAPFGAIYSSMALHHIPDTEGILHALYGALKPGGALCVVDLDPDDGIFHAREENYAGHHGFEQKAFAAAMAAAGFEHVQIETFYRDVKPVGAINHPYSLFCARGIKPGPPL